MPHPTRGLFAKQQRYFEEPIWQTGDPVIVGLLADQHRFFPKELTQRTNIGYLIR